MLKKIILIALIFACNYVQSQKNYEVRAKYYIHAKKNISNHEFPIFIPKDNVGYQKIHKSSYSSVPAPTKIIENEHNTTLVYNSDQFKKGDSIIVNLDLTLFSTGFNYNICRGKEKKVDQNLNRYLIDEPGLCLTSQKLNRVAKRLRGQSDEETINNIINHIADIKIKNIFFFPQNALETYKNGSNTYVSMPELLLALLRLNKIPSRLVYGVEFPSLKPEYWTEYYSQAYGWIPIFLRINGSTKKYDFRKFDREALVYEYDYQIYHDCGNYYEYEIDSTIFLITTHAKVDNHVLYKENEAHELFWQGKPDASLSLLNQILKSEPDRMKTNLLKALILQEKGMEIESIKHFDKMEALSCSDYMKSYFHYYSSLRNLSCKNLEEAVRDLFKSYNYSSNSDNIGAFHKEHFFPLHRIDSFQIYRKMIVKKHVIN